MNRPTFDEELQLWNNGFQYVIGVDEVGRGSFAGPVVACAVILKPYCTDLPFYKDINDSKLLSASKREKLEYLIKNNCMHYAIELVDVATINTIGIGKATTQAMCSAVDSLCTSLQNTSKNIYTLIDGYVPKNSLFSRIKTKGIIHGDRKSISIAAASIIAKVYRDAFMTQIHNEYPLYNFHVNKGYGTFAHREAIRVYGLSKIHRTSFNLKKYIV